MKYTDLNIFYQLGAALNQMMANIKIGCPVVELYIQTVMPIKWLEAFRIETIELSDTLRDTNTAVLNYLATINAIRRDIEQNFERTMTQDEMLALSHEKEEFEKCFEREHRNLDVFAVTPKGVYNTRLLIEAPERQVSERLRKALPDQTKSDLCQAGRCLAFDIPTACAFHICRGTEALMLAYYKLLAGHDWAFAKRDWKIFIEQLVKEGALPKITTRLDEIRAMDRNSYAHPDTNVSLDEAQVLFSLCSGVNYYMAEEVVRLTP